ncbi:carbohydrate kinase family protein [Sphaerisporangium sp. B11E5]|uniref:carbohydrate kinase family protein n=1 Tax=Sphaerisporangium sp. B11E5 TaxID=3153563 RepID=UPI00325E459D
MKRLDVIGNVSHDKIRYPDRRTGSRVGGAALLVALASVKGGRPAAPVCVLGNDLAHLPEVPGLDAIDWTAHGQVDGFSASFELEYDAEDELVAVRPDYGVAKHLTAHALAHIDRHPQDTYHVCCRRPLDVAAVLTRLAQHNAEFSVDFFLSSAEEMIRAAAQWLPETTTVFVNAAEYRLLENFGDPADLPELVVTNGPRAAVIRHFGEQTISVVPPPSTPREVSGAGDTLAGTFLARRSHGATPGQALAEAAIAAARYVAAPSYPMAAPGGG